MKELKKCEGCGRYFWVPIQPRQDGDNLAERLKFCKECWEGKLTRPTTLEAIERENQEMDEAEKQEDNYREEFSRRYKAN